MVMIRKASRFFILIMAAVVLFSVPVPSYADEADKKAEEVDTKRVLGKENIVPKEKLSKNYKRILIKDISFEGTSIQEVDETKHPDFKDVVRQLGKSVPDSIAAQLRAWGIFETVIREGEKESDTGKTITLEARFTKITTGNRAARFWVGFGAGSSTVGIAGKLVDKETGEVVADFENNAHSPASMSDYHGVLPADGSHNAKKIATFIKKYY